MTDQCHEVMPLQWEWVGDWVEPGPPALASCPVARHPAEAFFHHRRRSSRGDGPGPAHGRWPDTKTWHLAPDHTFSSATLPQLAKSPHQKVQPNQPGVGNSPAIQQAASQPFENTKRGRNLDPDSYITALLSREFEFQVRPDSLGKQYIALHTAPLPDTRPRSGGRPPAEAPSSRSSAVCATFDWRRGAAQRNNNTHKNQR